MTVINNLLNKTSTVKKQFINSSLTNNLIRKKSTLNKFVRGLFIKDIEEKLMNGFNYSYKT